MEDKRAEQQQTNNINYLKIFLILLFILLLPAAIIGILIYWVTFVRGKNRPSVISLYILPPVLILFLIDFFTKISSHLLAVDTPLFWLAIMTWQIRIGSLFGLGYIFYQSRLLQHNEYLKHIPGLFKDFKYNMTPWEKALKNKMKQSFYKGEYFNTDDEAPIGITEELKYVDPNGNIVKEDKLGLVFRYPQEAVTHTIVTGASGSGKTLTLSQMIENDVKSNIGVTILDNKKSPEFVYLCSRLAKKYNKKMYHFISGEPEDYINPLGNFQATYDPLASGDPNTKTDMIINMRKWDTSSDVYKNQSKTSILTIWFLLEQLGRENRDLLPEINWNKGGFWQFASALSPTNVAKMIEVLERVYSQKATVTEDDNQRLATLREVYKELQSRGQSGVRNQIGEYRNIFSQFTLSGYSGWLSKKKGIPHIDLERIILEEKDSIVLFSFNPQEEPEFSKAMGSLVLSDFSRVAAAKNTVGNKYPHRLYVDEFQTLPPERIKDNIEKARSAKIGITLSLQSFAQVLVESTDAVLQTIKDAVSTFIVHSGSTGKIAEMVSEISGEGRITEYSYTSNHSNRSIFKFKKGQPNINQKTSFSNLVTKSEINKLSAGTSGKSEIYLINKSCMDPHYKYLTGTIARKVQVLVSKEILEGIPKEMEAQWKEQSIKLKEKYKKIEDELYSEFNELAAPDGDWGIEEEIISTDDKDTFVLPANNPFKVNKAPVKTKYQDYFNTKKRRAK